MGFNRMIIKHMKKHGTERNMTIHQAIQKGRLMQETIPKLMTGSTKQPKGK